MSNISKDDLISKLNKLLEKAILELNKELHPSKLEEILKMETPLIKLITLSKYEGYGQALRDLGADTTNLDSLLNNEVDNMESTIEKMIIKNVTD